MSPNKKSLSEEEGFLRKTKELMRKDTIFEKEKQEITNAYWNGELTIKEMYSSLDEADKRKEYRELWENEIENNLLRENMETSLDKSRMEESYV